MKYWTPKPKKWYEVVWRPARDAIANAWYWLRCHTITRYHILDLRSPKNNFSWGWEDCDRRMLAACFNLLKLFVEEEIPFKYHHLKDDPVKDPTGLEIWQLYQWWTVERPARLAWPIDFEMAKTYDEQDNKMLSRLMAIRESLWT